MNKVTIGVRREENTLATPGPGAYSPEKGDLYTMTRSAEADFSRQIERGG